MEKELIKLRKERGVTPDRLADIIGISPTAYKRKEEGISLFEIFEMFKISNYFNIDISNIFK